MVEALVSDQRQTVAGFDSTLYTDKSQVCRPMPLGLRRQVKKNAGTLAGAAGVGAAATAGLAVGIAGGAAYGLTHGTGWVLENTSSGPSRAARTRPCRTSGPPTT